MSKSIIKIFTDGSCIGNPGPGAFALAIVMPNHHMKTTHSDFFEHTTNNIMELSAMKCAFDTMINIQDSGDNLPRFATTIKFYTDSQYVIKGLTEWRHNWIKRKWKKVKNSELWKETISSYEILSTISKVEFEHVRAHTTGYKDHSPEYYNDIVDKLAQDIARGQGN